MTAWSSFSIRDDSSPSVESNPGGRESSMTSTYAILPILLTLSGGSSPPSVCRSLGADEQLLKRLGSSPGETLTLKDILQVVPGPMSPSDSDTPHRMFTWSGRVIDGECECCTTFVFDTGSADDARGLTAVIVKRTSHRAIDAIDELDRLVRATGAPPKIRSEVLASTRPGAPPDSFSWNSVDETLNVDAQVYKSSVGWTAALHLTRTPRGRRSRSPPLP
jgi:hypothetical protein